MFLTRYNLLTDKNDYTLISEYLTMYKHVIKYTILFKIIYLAHVEKGFCPGYTLYTIYIYSFHISKKQGNEKKSFIQIHIGSKSYMTKKLEWYQQKNPTTLM